VFGKARPSCRALLFAGREQRQPCKAGAMMVKSAGGMANVPHSCKSI